MFHAHRAIPRTLLVLIGLALASAGCGPGASPASSASPSSASAAPASSASSAPASAAASTAGGGFATWKPAAMTDEQAQRVVDLSLAAVAQLGYAAGYEDGAIATMTGLQAYLGNLALSLVGQPEEAWPDLIAKHFATAFAQPASNAPVPSSWQEARLFLRIAVRADGYFQMGSVTRPVTDGIVAGLAYDKGGTFVVVPRAVFDQWGIPEDQAFETGLANTLLEPGLTVDRDETDNVVYAVDSPFASTYLLAVDRLFASAAPNGALVGVPTRAKVIAVPIRSAVVTEALELYPDTIRRDFEAGPYPVSSRLFWWYGGRLTPITDAAGKLVIPAQLQAILDSLGG